MIFVLAILPAMIGLVGITFDVGHMIAAHRQASNLAGSAARAGAQVFDQQLLYQEGLAGVQSGLAGETGVLLGGTTAEARARELAEAAGASSVLVTIDGKPDASGGFRMEFVNVKLKIEVQPQFLGLFGIGVVELEGRSSARLRSAVENDDYDTSIYVDQ